MRIRLVATAAGMFGGLQAAHESLAVIYEAVRADCANPGDAKLMLLCSLLEQAYAPPWR
jgi:hypothetical protein